MTKEELTSKAKDDLPKKLALSDLNPTFRPALFENIRHIQDRLRPIRALSSFANTITHRYRLQSLPRIKLPRIERPALNIPKIDWNGLHERDEQALRFAARQNWFIQPETAYTFHADIDECKADIDQLNRIFIQMMKNNEVDIHSRLISNYPTHAPLIAEMFRLHDEKRFLASIPLALICAEGIAYGVTKESIFNTDKNRPAIAGWLDHQNLPKLAKTFLSSLTEQYPMSWPRPDKLNRHRVLHGNDTDYGSELFSYQAISLLGFVGWAFAAEGLVNEYTIDEE